MFWSNCSALSLAFTFVTWWKSMIKKSCFNSVIFHMTMSTISVMTFLTTVSLSLSYETAFTIFSIVISFMNLNLQSNSLFVVANVGNHSIYRLFISLSYWLTREKVLSVSGHNLWLRVCDFFIQSLEESYDIVLLPILQNICNCVTRTNRNWEIIF